MSAQTTSAVELIDRLIATPVEERPRVLGELGNAGLLSALIEHAGKMTLADAAKVDQATDALVNLADRMGTPLDRARARRARARALSYAGRFREALFACEEGLRLAEEVGSTIEAGRSRLASMHALGELGRLEEAIIAGEAARDAFLHAGETALAARADLNIGTVHQRGDDPQTALQCFDRARPLLLNEPMILGPLDNNRGEALVAMNDFAGAERAFSQALETLQHSHAPAAAAIVESNLADVAARQGRLQAAMVHFEQARRFLETGASPVHLARVLAEQADAMGSLGMPREALAEYERALQELDRLGLVLEAARARTGLGTVLLRLGRYSQAETALAASATAFAELGHATARARVDLLRAELAAANGRDADARAMALRALAALHDRPAESAAAHLLLGRLAQTAGHEREADADFAHALALAEQLDLAPLQADILHARGRGHHRRRALDAAIADLKQAMQHIERVRGSLQADRFRAAFLGDRAAIYEELATALLDRGDEGDLQAAFTVIDQAKSRVLREQMRRDLADESPVGVGQGDEEPLLQRLRAARADLNALYSVVHDDRRRTRVGESEWREMLRRREGEVDAIESRLATTGVASTLVSEPASIASLQAALPDHAAVIVYFTEGDRISAFIIRTNDAVLRRGFASMPDLASRLHRLQFEINRALVPGAMEGSRGGRLMEDAHRVLDDLGEALLTPLSEHLKDTQSIVVVPHGDLHAAPLHALRLHGRALAESHTVTYAPSASILLQMLQPHASEPADTPAVVVGVSDTQAPQMADEARAVAALLQGAGMDATLLVGDDAAAQRVSDAIAHVSLIHLACHGRYAPETPLASGLRMSDRWITAREMLRWRLAGAAITLSGCDTGLSEVQSGDELKGLVRSLLAAGASSVLASLWRVNDSTTREFMAAYYGCLRRVNHAAVPAIATGSALRAAQLQLMRTHRHPAFWAPFVLAGRP